MSAPSDEDPPYQPGSEAGSEEEDEMWASAARRTGPNVSRGRPFQPTIVTKSQHARAEAARKLHECMGHPSTRRLMESISSGKITDCQLTSADIRRAEEIFGRCRACEAAKASAPKAKPSESEPAEQVGFRVHLDVLFTKGKADKKQKVLISVDEFSGFIYVVDLPHLTKSEMSKALEKISNFYTTKAGKAVENYVTDRDKSFVSMSQSNVVKIKLVAAGRHARVAERQIRHVKNMMRSIIYNLPYELPHSWYVNALFYCVCMTNFTVRSGRFNVPTTPAELVLGTKLNYNNVMRYPFGKIVMPYQEDHAKDEARAYEGVVLGFDQENHGTLEIAPIDSKRETTYTHVKPREIKITQDIIDRLNTRDRSSLLPLLENLDGYSFEYDESSKEEEEQVEELMQLVASSVRRGNDWEREFDESSESEHGFAETVNSASTIEGTNEADDGNLSLAQALSVFSEREVVDSIMGEINNMHKHGVMEYIKLDDFRKVNPRGRSLLPSKVFLKGKYDAMGRFTKLKSRLVAGGHRQKPDTYGRTSSPTVDISHVMLCLSLVKKLKAKVATIDVAAAFLHAKLEEEIYMILPRDIVEFLNANDETFKRDISGGGSMVVVKLLKSLYGLKQSARNWHITLNNFLKTQGFKAIQAVDT